MATADHAQLANLAAMARSIFHQVGATEVAQPELTILVNFNGANGSYPLSSLIADDSPSSFLDDGHTSKLIRQILGAVSEFDKAMTGAKLKGARDRKRRINGKCEGRKSYAERDPKLVDMARWLHHKADGRPYSLRQVAAQLLATVMSRRAADTTRRRRLHRCWLDARKVKRAEACFAGHAMSVQRNPSLKRKPRSP